MNKTLSALALLALLSACATSTPPDYRVGIPATPPQDRRTAEQTHAQQTAEIVLAGHDASPQVLKSRFPDYPQSWRNRGIQGQVIVHFTIGADGEVSSPSVVGSPPPELAEISLQAILQWKFKPALKDGKPVAVRAQQEFSFSVK